MKDNLLIGAISGNYTIKDIQTWVDTSEYGFSRTLIVFNAKDNNELIPYLKSKNIKYILPTFDFWGNEKDFFEHHTGRMNLQNSFDLIHNMRFMYIHRYLQEESSFAILMSFITAIGLSGALITSGLTIFPVSSILVEKAPFLFLGWRSVDELYWVSLFIIAAGATAALSLMTRAYQLTRTSYAAVFEYSYLISVGFFSWIFWGIVPNFLSIIGIVLIIISGTIITLAQRNEEKVRRN